PSYSHSAVRPVPAIEPQRTCLMYRARKFLAPALAFACALGFFSVGSMRQTLNAASAPSFGLQRPWMESSTFVRPAQRGLALLDRLLRRPNAMLGNLSTPAGFGLRFDGVNDYVTFGTALSLGAPKFTLEVWFMREGPGVATTSGSGGLSTAVPLVTKGRAEAEGSNL